MWPEPWRANPRVRALKPLGLGRAGGPGCRRTLWSSGRRCAARTRARPTSVPWAARGPCLVKDRPGSQPNRGETPQMVGDAMNSPRHPAPRAYGIRPPPTINTCRPHEARTRAHPRRLSRSQHTRRASSLQTRQACNAEFAVWPTSPHLTETGAPIARTKVAAGNQVKGYPAVYANNMPASDVYIHTRRTFMMAPPDSSRTAIHKRCEFPPISPMSALIARGRSSAWATSCAYGPRANDWTTCWKN